MNVFVLVCASFERVAETRVRFCLKHVPSIRSFNRNTFHSFSVLSANVPNTIPRPVDGFENLFVVVMQKKSLKFYFTNPKRMLNSIS